MRRTNAVCVMASFMHNTFKVNPIKLYSMRLFSCRYDHLAKVLTKVLDERPENVVDVFEDISKKEKKEKFTSNVDTVQNKIDKSTEVALAEIQEKLFSVILCVTYMVIHPMQNFFKGFYVLPVISKCGSVTDSTVLCDCFRKETARKRSLKMMILKRPYRILWNLYITLNKPVLA